MPQIDIINELYIFVFAIIYGLLLGLIYDVYRVIRYYSKPKKLLTATEDLIFWIIITLTIFTFLVEKLDGIIRGFILLAFGIGYIIYIKFISKYSFSFLKWIFKLILSLINEIMNIIFYPFRKIGKFLGKRLKKVRRIVKIGLDDAKKYLIMTKKKK